MEDSKKEIFASYREALKVVEKCEAEFKDYTYL